MRLRAAGLGEPPRSNSLAALARHAHDPPVPAYPEPIDRRFRLVDGRDEPVDWPPLVWEHAARTRFVYRVTRSAEPYYLLTTTYGASGIIPERHCGPCDPAGAGVAAREFFQTHDFDLALDVERVERVTAFLGCVAFPSGFMASPWMADADLHALRCALRAWHDTFTGEPHLL